jgi:predicted aldo/keto reductase-like oxidoreductase
MELRPLRMSGVLVSVIGLGTWPMGGEWWGGTDDAESIRTIHRAIDLGVTLIDTAWQDRCPGSAELAGGAAGGEHGAGRGAHDWRDRGERGCGRLGAGGGRSGSG